MPDTGTPSQYAEREMSIRVRDFDWSSTPLGPRPEWPAGLRALTEMLLAHPLAMILLWGPELVQIYNDPYRLMMGDRHPGGLGQPTRECWPEAWNFTAPVYQGVLERGETLAFQDQPLTLQRHGHEEQAFFTLSFSPVHDESGAVAGVLATVVETTSQIHAQREARERQSELDSRNTTLAAFAELSRDLTLDTDPDRLILRAQEAVLPLLHAGFSQYYEPEGGLWRVRSQVGPVGSPELQAILDAGLPFGDTPNLLIPWQSGEAYYQEEYDPAVDGLTGGGPYPRATVTLPVRVGGQIRGVLGFALNEARPWSRADHAVLQTLERSLSLALERAEQTRQLEEERAALAAFARFTETSTQVTDVLVLAERAAEVLRATLGNVNAAYYELEEERWKARVLSGDVPAPIAEAARAGFDANLPSFARPFQERAVVFVNGWDAVRQGTESSEAYGAGALYPYFEQGFPSGLFTMGAPDARTWTERERSIFLAVSRSLGLAIERAAQNRRLAAQNAELDARTRALEGFAELTRDLSVEVDPYTLVRRAQEVALSLLSDGYALYYEREGERWRNRVQVGEVGNAALQSFIDAGPPVGVTPSVDVPWTTRRALYQDVYAKGSDTPAEMVGHINAAASLPVLNRGEVVGVFITVLFTQRLWTSADKAVLETVVRSLGLAIEGAQGVAELAEERRKLEAANRELEAFSYSVSHDLRTPVRHIMGFGALLRKSLEGRLDDRSGRYLKVMDEAAGRMNTLIDALLELARTSQLPLQVGTVNLDELVRTVAAELEADVLERQVEWWVAPLPRVVGDHDTLRQVVVNLLSNALKYTRPRDVTRIRVWAEERPDEWAVFVQDNGVGFDPRYEDKLFGVFQRLHRQDEFEGTGVGLANVRRIVTRHGGQVTATGEPGRGATFGFTLPKQPRVVD